MEEDDDRNDAASVITLGAFTKEIFFVRKSNLMITIFIFGPKVSGNFHFEREMGSIVCNTLDTLYVCAALLRGVTSRFMFCHPCQQVRPATLDARDVLLSPMSSVAAVSHGLETYFYGARQSYGHHTSILTQF